MEKVFVAKRVAKKLFKTEAAVDGAMTEATELLGEILKVYPELRLSTVFADDVQVKMMEALKALSDARTAMVGVHHELNEAKLRLGIRTEMNGDDKGTLRPPRGVDSTATTMREVG